MRIFSSLCALVLFVCSGFGVVADTSLPNTLAPIVEKVIDGIVQLDVVEDLTGKAGSAEGTPFFDFFFDNPDKKDNKSRKAEFLGSGIIIKQVDKLYYVLTNNHVIGDAVSIKVTVNKGDQYDAKLIGKDAKRDLAIVSFESKEKYPVIQISDSDQLRLGDFVLAIGSPYGYQSSVSFGIVSGLNRRGGPDSTITDFIQTDAAINKGNSGGALLNLKGELVGVNTWITSQSGGSVGLGFAVPSNETKKVIADLIKYGELKNPWLGVNMFSLDEKLSNELLGKKSQAVLVTGLYLNSPAYLSGIRPGDIITSINNKKTELLDDVVQIVASKSVGEKLRVSILRDKKEMSILATLLLRPDDKAVTEMGKLVWPGFSVYPITEELLKQLNLDVATKGMIVRQVINQSNADKAELKFSDIILSINDKPIESSKDFFKLLNELGPSKGLTLKVNRLGKELTIQIKEYN